MTRREPRWDIDLARGQAGEQFIRDIFKSEASTVEVKTDDRWIDTGKIFIEEECCGRDGIWRKSGLLTTTAKLHALVINDRQGAVILETEWLRKIAEFARRNPMNKASCTRGSNPTRGILINLSHLWSMYYKP
jgi:hypothetical protein